MAEIFTIGDAQAAQRIDNFLFTQLKGVPKSRIYRALRQGEVRVNKKRMKPTYRLQLNDQVRLPPIRISDPSPTPYISDALKTLLLSRILHEDESVLIINKPSGLPVHGGTGQKTGLIETLRLIHPNQQFLELVHRLDRETSGCLIIAKKRSALIALQAQFKTGGIKKTYSALVKGRFLKKRTIDWKLSKNHLASGERIVKVDPDGKQSLSVFNPIEIGQIATLVEIDLLTGRTHQIRVHAAHAGHPVAGDQKYGNKAFNQLMRKQGLSRLFLHAKAISFELNGKTIECTAPLDKSELGWSE